MKQRPGSEWIYCEASYQNCEMNIHCPGTWDSHYHGISREIRILSSAVFKGSCYTATSTPCRLRQQDCEFEASLGYWWVQLYAGSTKTQTRIFHDLLKSNPSDSRRRKANFMSPSASLPQSAEWLAGPACRELHQLWVCSIPTNGVTASTCHWTTLWRFE